MCAWSFLPFIAHKPPPHTPRLNMALEEIGNRDMGEWLLPFKGKNHSGSVATNFVWKSGNVYVMDNHRVALWCWLQELDLTKQHSLVHIDRHTDTRQSNLVETLNSLPLWDCGLFEYLEHEFAYSGNVQKVITWDCLLYTSPSPRDQRGSRMPSSA